MMKYILNKLPVKTTNGFKINDVKLDFIQPSFKMNHEFDISGDTSSLIIKKEVKHDTFTSKIGIKNEDYYDINIQIPKDVHIKDSVRIQYTFSKDEALYSKLNICFEENSSCDFIIMIDSKDEEASFSHILENVVSYGNSVGTITVINQLNQNSMSFYALENVVLENSSITHTIIDMGGKTRLYNVYSDLTEKNAKNYLNTIYIGKNDELLDFNYYLKNIGENTNNQMKVEGVIGDCCHKNFRGTIDFIKGCSNSIGEENENCVLLTDTCRSRSLPQLLCGEENVVGAHGVSSGKVSEDKLFYLMSKGYNQKEAERLIVLGNFMSILGAIPSEEVRTTLLEQIEKEI